MPRDRTRPLSQVEVEQALMEEADHLEALTNGGTSPKTGTEFMGYDAICELAAETEADWKINFAEGMILQASKPAEGRGERRDLQEARVTKTHAEDLRAYLKAKAVKDAAKEALVTSRTRIDAIRTIAANVRAQT